MAFALMALDGLPAKPRRSLGDRLKGVLAQAMLLHRWGRARMRPTRGGGPVARLTIPRLGIDRVVVTGGRRELAVGPVHFGPLDCEEAARVIIGDPNTHFRFLGELVRGDELVLGRPDGAVATYQVAQAAVVRTGRDRIGLPSPSRTLALITWLPFSSIDGDLRYVVLAQRKETVSGVSMPSAAIA